MAFFLTHSSLFDATTSGVNVGITFIVNGLEIYPHPETIRIVIPIANDLMGVICGWRPPEGDAPLKN